MQSLKEKIRSNKKPYHFMAYCVSLIGIASVITALGPLIPYMSELSGIEQTEYSLLFLARSIGFVVGGISIKWLERNISYRSILIYFSIISFVSLLAFSITLNIIFQSIWIIVISIVAGDIGIIINISILHAQTNNHQQFWMLIAQGVFGIGGLLGPILVSFFQQKSYLFMGFIILIICPIYYMLQSPQEKQSKKRENTKSLLQSERVYSYSQSNIEFDGNKKQKSAKSLMKEMEYLLCFMFFLYVGEETAFGGWISPYAVLQKVSDKDQATTFSSFFWISIAIFRFVASFINKKTSEKFNFLLKSYIISTLIVIVFLQLNLVYLSCIFSSFAFGVCTSSFYGLILSLPSQYGIQLTARQNGILMIYGSLGQGTLSMFVGYLIKWISYNMLFYMMFLMIVGLNIGFHYFTKLAIQLKQKTQGMTQMSEMSQNQNNFDIIDKLQQTENQNQTKRIE